MKSSARGRPARTWQNWDSNPLRLQSTEGGCQIQGGSVCRARAQCLAGGGRRSFPFPSLRSHAWNPEGGGMRTERLLIGAGWPGVHPVPGRGSSGGLARPGCLPCAQQRIRPSCLPGDKGLQDERMEVFLLQSNICVLEEKNAYFCIQCIKK